MNFTLKYPYLLQQESEYGTKLNSVNRLIFRTSPPWHFLQTWLSSYQGKQMQYHWKDNKLFRGKVLD